MKDVGFIGLGRMDTSTAPNLLAAGCKLFLLTRSEVHSALTAANGITCKSSGELSCASR